MIRPAGVDPARALRLGAFASSATVLALAAHVVAGGAPPAPAPTLAAVALPMAAGHLLSRRRRGRLEIAVVLGSVQLALHEVFAATAHGSGAAHPGHDVPADHLQGHAPGWMPFAHLAAVLVTALVLAHGERLLHLLAQWLRWVPLRPARPPAPVGVVRGRPVAAGRPVHELPARRACAPLVRRGPPPPCR